MQVIHTRGSSIHAHTVITDNGRPLIFFPISWQPTQTIWPSNHFPKFKSRYKRFIIFLSMLQRGFLKVIFMSNVVQPITAFKRFPSIAMHHGYHRWAWRCATSFIHTGAGPSSYMNITGWIIFCWYSNYLKITNHCQSLRCGNGLQPNRDGYRSNSMCIVTCYKRCKTHAKNNA